MAKKRKGKKNASRNNPGGATSVPQQTAGSKTKRKAAGALDAFMEAERAWRPPNIDLENDTNRAEIGSLVASPIMHEGWVMEEDCCDTAMVAAAATVALAKASEQASSSCCNMFAGDGKVAATAPAIEGKKEKEEEKEGGDDDNTDKNNDVPDLEPERPTMSKKNASVYASARSLLGEEELAALQELDADATATRQSVTATLGQSVYFDAMDLEEGLKTNENEDEQKKKDENTVVQKSTKDESSSEQPNKESSCCSNKKKDDGTPAQKLASKPEENTDEAQTQAENGSKRDTAEPKESPQKQGAAVAKMPEKTTTANKTKEIPQKLSPKKGDGSCCASKSKPSPPPHPTQNTASLDTPANDTPCGGCGDNCRCGVENGWSFCQCGPNCKCSDPLMAEGASLLLESTGQKPPTTQPDSSFHANHNNIAVEDPLKAPSSSTRVLDLEAGNNQDHQGPTQSSPRPIFVDIVVGGMTCTMCSQAITRALTGMEGIQGVTVSLSTDVAHVEMDPNKESQYASLVEEIQDMISDIGYMVVDVITMPNKFLKSADRGTDGVNNGNDELSPILDGDSRSENDADDDARLGDNNTQQDRWNRIAQRQEEKLLQKKRAFLWSLIGTLPILLLTMILPHILPSSFRWWERQEVHLFHKSIPLESLLLWVLATPVQFICGWEFYKSSYYGLFRTGTLGMDVLVVLGTTASYGYALYATFSDQPKESHFFETSAVLICFVLLGKWMQALAVHRTSDALSQLMSLQPETALRVMPIDENHSSSSWDPMKEAYREELVPTKELQRGDIVKIVPGSSLPADGVVLAGELAVDESMVTGESLPVLKTKGSVVLGGTVCVESSSLDESAPGATATSAEQTPNETGNAGQVAFCQVTGVGSSTALAQIIQLVQDAQASKVPMQNFADTVSSIFVPVVATLSIITFLVWYALCSTGVVPEQWYTNMNEDAATFSLMFGIACLVISCPCALGLATPTAVMVGTGMGAQLGILMKGGEALEAASQVNAVVLDKTGTVTTAKPSVTDFVLLNKSAGGGYCGSKKKDAPSQAEGKPLSKETILWLLGSLERSSEHPLAKAIVAYAEEELSRKKKGPSYLEEKPFLQPSEFRSMTGRGASGYLHADGNDANRYFVAVGNRAFFASLEVEVTVDIDDQMKELEEQGKTAILAAINYEFYVILGVADELKPDAKAAVAYLRNEMNIEVWMVTGDNARTAQAIARQLDLPPQQVVSEALPNAKVHQVKKLQLQGKTVAHVGDGINDSPALAQANVGISIGTGAAIAAEASDMVLVRGQYVADVCTALDLCRVIFARIQWNFLWSLVYNCLGIPLAAGVCFPIFHTRLPPTVAALAMALSSVSVVFSSLALRLYKPPNVENYQYRPRPSPAAASSQPVAASQPGTVGGAASGNLATPGPNPRRGGPQLVTSLSLDLGPTSSSELAQPLLANQHLPDSGPSDKATASMEEGLGN